MRELTPEAHADRCDFLVEYGHYGNCSCHISPPCASCLHPGNPNNQEEDESCWIEVPDDEENTIESRYTPEAEGPDEA